MGTALIFLILLVVVGGGLLYALGAVGTAKSKQIQTALDPRDEHLRYEVPAGQDPAVLVAALYEDGYQAAPEMVEGRPYVVVPCRAGRDRERAHVRAILANAQGTSLEGGEGESVSHHVVFEDEKQDESSQGRRRA